MRAEAAGGPAVETRTGAPAEPIVGEVRGDTDRGGANARGIDEQSTARLHL